MFNYHLEFKDFETFVTLYNCRSFTKAADHLYISQSALSRRVKQLEEELGVTLVKRGGINFEITDAGHKFYEHCIRLLQEKDNIYASINRYRSGDEGGLRITADPNFFSLHMIIEAITELNDEYPQILVNFKSVPNLDVYRLLTDDKTDIAFTQQSVAEEYRDLAYTVLRENKLVVGLGRNHHLFNREGLCWDDLNGEKLTVAMQTNNPALEKLMLHARKNGCRFSNILFVPTTAEALGYVASGEYLTMNVDTGVELYKEMSKYLRFVPVNEEDNCLGWPVAAYRANNDNPLIEKLISIMKKRDPMIHHSRSPRRS